MRDGDHIALELRIVACDVSIKTRWTVEMDTSTAGEPQGRERGDGVGNDLSIGRGLTEANLQGDYAASLASLCCRTLVPRKGFSSV